MKQYNDNRDYSTVLFPSFSQKEQFSKRYEISNGCRIKDTVTESRRCRWIVEEIMRR